MNSGYSMIKPSRYYFFILFTVLPHFFILPLDIGVLITGLFAWTGIYCYRHRLRPSVWPLRGLTLSALLFCVVRFGTLANPTAATSLLCLITVLKLFETQSYRDAMALLIISLLIVMSYLIESYSLLASIYMVTVFVLAIYFMMELQRKRYYLQQTTIRWSDLFSWELVVALPLLVGLFVFFPRFTTRLGTGERQVQTVGFSDQIELGQMVQLVQSNEVAFKVRFLTEKRLAENQLYFRGAVLTRPKNMSWVKSTASGAYYEPAGNIIKAEYQILMPPRQQKNLFTLANSVLVRSNPRLFLLEKKAENIFYMNSALEQNLSYSVATERNPTITFTKEDLHVPEETSLHSRPIALALKGDGDERSLQNILNYFKDSNFQYSTEVPAYKHIGEFLQTKVGFCEHFASAFALLSRELGVPSRVVVGFVGGEINPYDNTLTVRDRFAHAWVEVFLKDKGWMRVDPTGVIYPQRMDNLMATVGPGDQFYSGILFQPLLFLESINTQFEMFLMGYNNDSQWSYLTRFSEYLKWNVLVLVFAIPIFFALAFGLLWWVWRLEWRKADPLIDGYMLILKKLNRFGMMKHPSQGPLEFNKIVQMSSKVPQGYSELIQRYIVLRYSHSGHTESAIEFYRQVQKLR